MTGRQTETGRGVVWANVTDRGKSTKILYAGDEEEQQDNEKNKSTKVNKQQKESSWPKSRIRSKRRKTTEQKVLERLFRVLLLLRCTETSWMINRENKIRK